MEHLDLAGFITTPTHWMQPAFDQQDAVYLSNSRQMLEPILEETSEDEERAQNSWSQYDQATQVWSSAESETGSVIRIEITKDPDSISERDFACPAKRARRSDEFLNIGLPQQQPTCLEDTVVLRKFQRNTDAIAENNSLERFLAYEAQFGTASSRDSLGASSQQRSSTGSRRFDDFYSDSDSLSYHSLSRSSSLIQFESLERQLLQDQHSSLTSLGNSSPSLLSFEGACSTDEVRKSNSDIGGGSGSGGNSGCNSGNNSRRGSQSSLLKRFESSDGRLHQTYYDLDKLNFDEDEDGLAFGSAKAVGGIETIIAAEAKSDSESSTSSSSSSGNSILTASKPSAEDLTDAGAVNNSSSTAARIAAYQRAGGKNSAENLSEDSGYCEPSTLRRTKSKSIPKNFEKFCEEDEFYSEPEHKAILVADAEVAHAAAYENDERNDAQNTHSKNSTVIEHDICQPKIAAHDATFVVESAAMLATAPTETQTTWLCYDSVKNSPLDGGTQQEQQLKQQRSMAHSPSPVSDAGSTISSSSCASANSFTWLPTHSHSTQQQQQQQPQQREHHQMLLNSAQRRNRQLPQSPDFSEQLRNSLPDIRDANGLFAAYDDYFSPTSCTHRNGYVVDQLKSISPAPHQKQRARTRTCSLTDSDTSSAETASSTSDASSSTESHSAKEVKSKRTIVGGGVGSCGRGSSVPNELDRIGRKKRSKAKYSKSSTSNSSAVTSSESELTDEDVFDANTVRIRRSCSWSERRERNLQKFEGAFGQNVQCTERQPLATQSLGYMNASYHNLTLLDYSERKTGSKSHANFKRCAWNMDSRKSSGDYESIICKDNFLLDELSEIYDKNASILNDKQLDAPKVQTDNNLDALMPVSPKPPPRQRKHSNSSYSDLDTPDTAEIQHVQLTIRKPPARQKNGRKQDAPSSLVNEMQPPFTSFGKTFDQDPTNLRTSYAQSLEKCNFDANEISNNDLSLTHSLPKRRFHAHAANKKRNMVSSTPNLNAFDPRADELEDDIYVSSAHTSMHQLPQGAVQKPLGILLPAGSRTSFGKEVSFCPVVSKYCWQEQSSEECNEPQMVRQDGKEEEETDDELLDNADATVIYNTKENELIAARYAKEKKSKEQQQQQREPHSKEQQQREREAQRECEAQRAAVPLLVEKVRAVIVLPATSQNIATVKTSQTNAHERTAQNVMEKLVSSESSTTEVATSTSEATQVSLKTTTIVATTLARRNSENEESNRNVNTSIITTTTRPVSLHLPILSEPPTNRAHILYASQQMIDNLQQQEQQDNEIARIRAQSANNLNTSSNMNQQQQQVDKVRLTRMSNQAAKSRVDNANENSAAQQSYNNNNEMVKSKFKADEKHPSSKGFLSRFANGFRFSLRRNKKKQLQQQQQQQMLEQNGALADQLLAPKTNNVAAKTNAPNSVKPKAGKQNSPDFIYIPLKGPLPGSASVASANASASASNDSNASTASISSAGKHVPMQPAVAIVTGKPPLPKQPPRVEKQPPSQQSAGQAAHYQPQQQHFAGNAANFAANQFYTAKPTRIDECFLDSERSYYDEFKNQLNSGMHANGRMYDTSAAAAATSVSMDPNPSAGNCDEPLQQFVSPSRASVSQKTQMFNNMSHGNGLPAAQYAKNNNGCKIGLIETNLDTHETVISGKTRSLMELGPQQQLQQHQQRYKFIKRLNAGAGGNGYQTDMVAVDDDDDDDDDDINNVVVDGNVVIVKGVPQQAGQIASVRRPHKSMEFLLDKENQKNVLPPENELQKSHEHNPNALSEHQLRVQASLQRLNIPDWFRQYNQSTARSPDGSNAYKPGHFTRKRTSESGRWAGLNSKTTSLSSLGSQRSDRSPLLLSPSAHSHHGGQTSAHGAHQQHSAGAHSVSHTAGTGGGGGSFSRWSTSHLNSSQTSPSCSQRGSFSRGGPVNSSFMSVASGQSGMSAVRSSFRQPYMGWRSQEKLSQRTPHERLASSLLAAQQQRTPLATKTSNGGIKQQPVTPEIQSSIKEVTSAIVHYVNDQTQQQRSRSTSPNSRKCWLESSFVGIRPLDSPQTPIIENTNAFSATTAAAAGLISSSNNYNYTSNNNNNNSISSGYYNNSSATSSIHSATNIDVLRMNGLSCVAAGGELAGILI